VVAVARGRGSWWVWLVVEIDDEKRRRISEGLDAAWCVVSAF
jgi:hypothetical protein